MRREETPFHSSCKYFHFVFSFRVEIHNQRLLPPLTANDPTSATNPEHKSAVANNTTSVHRVVSGRSSSVLSSTPEKPNLITRTTSATPPHPGKQEKRRHYPRWGDRKKQDARTQPRAGR